MANAINDTSNKFQQYEELKSYELPKVLQKVVGANSKTLSHMSAQEYIRPLAHANKVGENKMVQSENFLHGPTNVTSAK